MLFVAISFATAAPEASAQVGSFTEIPVPSDSAILHIPTNPFYLAGQVVVRKGQQRVAFDTKIKQSGNGTSYSRMHVRLSGGSWIQLYSGSFTTGVREWTPPASLAPGPYSVEVRVRIVGAGPGGQVDVVYPFTLVIVPGAQRAFRSTEGALRHTILHWKGGSADFDQPLLIVEGIDASNENQPGSYYALGTREGAQSLFARAQAAGADISILDFGDGGRDMRQNAAVVDEAVVFLRSRIMDPKRSLDVAGVSMGGVVARYALAKMEQENRLHRVASFVSIDAPQQGAVIDANFQYDIRNGVDAAEAPPALTRRASLQLLQSAAFDTSSPSEHIRFFNDIQALNGGVGYPRLTDNVGVSFGSSAPNPGTGQRWLTLNVSGLCAIGQWVAPAQCGDKTYDVAGPTAATGLPGSFLPVEQTQAFGTAAWGLVYYYTTREEGVDPTFIPYASALDLNGSTSKFDAPLISATAATFHDRIPINVTDDLLNRLGFELPNPTSVSISGPGSLPLGQRGYFRASTPNPMAGYQYTWEYSVQLPSCSGSLATGSQGADSGTSAQIGTGPGGPTTQAPQCGETIVVPGDGAVFSYKSSTSLLLTVTVRARNGAASVSTQKTVCVGNCSGGGSGPGSPAPKTANEAAALDLEPVYPNPASQSGSVTFSFSLSEAEPARVAVYDALGREVAVPFDGLGQQGTTSFSWSTNALPAGVYSVRLVSGVRSAHRRFTVAR